MPLPRLRADGGTRPFFRFTLVHPTPFVDAMIGPECHRGNAIKGPPDKGIIPHVRPDEFAQIKEFITVKPQFKSSFIRRKTIRFIYTKVNSVRCRH